MPARQAHPCIGHRVQCVGLLQGEWQRAGPQHRRFGGRSVNRAQEPTSRDSTPRVRPGEPGWREVAPQTINQPLDSREIEQHLPHVWANVRGAFRSRYTMPVRNALENLKYNKASVVLNLSRTVG